ncbi:conserved membrane hypothetical protein [Nostocoides japonicum T1-X7]|uniref:Transmembrane protein n=1 Tax=Nostocoides japonicum T1-X7 TaxID=1194083 RepID=A0A077LZ55_9MICO|nr:hypothetical protein [Tetrasphaera japonica]CCH77280.1 conserved membrane hypothetical protein [Tetrasphaera japonica T1-X7]
MSTAQSIAVAITFVWLGMVLAISFIEAPVKFRAPDVTLRIGLGIGRLVFRVLNVVELVLAVVLAVCLVMGTFAAAAEAFLLVACVLLLAQLLAVRPRLNRRTRAVLEGLDAPGSHAHRAYIGLECAKVVVLLVGGVLLLAG